ncbi:MAG: HAD hydrolase-like protein [Burkholderiales bacterium]|nr:HAD hydrolase-like protein [Burkholderiales bacterium]
MPITTLFFDLDGTVSNNFEGIARCLNYALQRLDLPLLSNTEVHPFVGPPFRESLPRVFPGIDVEAALRLYRERYDELGWQENRLYDGIDEAVRQLHLQGFTIALCTSKPRVFAERIIGHFGLERYFDGIHGPELDGRFDRKTDLLAHLVTRYNVAPEVAVMIGDRDKDIEAAQHAGTHSLGVLWGFGSDRELRLAGASRIIESPTQLVHTIHAMA